MSTIPQSLLNNPVYAPSFKETAMGSFIADGGPFMYLILMTGAAAAVLAIVRGKRATTGSTVSTVEVNTVLYLGIAALLLGIVGQLTGLYQAASAILRASAISPPVIAKGILISFNTTLLGFYMLIASGLLWFILRALVQRSRTH
jgi:hypothetical protein